ncbi:hypothetical protein IQ273_03215 [Nodosilinea sp. LEGE 07298]|jgi:hypothetical protein|uniref:hypothetical protein n=1 Tax=Nodosilinea sp. LEGE 07298 TaxID=2777970 RepID=UPI00187F0D72|nr:hypothetical protein [Nodosilinea sp. LEGE 07298]MBE9108428.1 hypothetical protein [Nodosilinea sp. LEGE 07298]
MAPTFSIRRLVEQALHSGLLTPDIEQGINSELSRLGYLPIGDSEALELLMYEMDEGRIRLVPGLGIYGEPIQQPVST